MTIVSVSEGNLIVEVEGWDKLWSLRSRLVIPIHHVIRVYADPNIAESWWKGLRLAGTHLPGSPQALFIITAIGSFGMCTTRKKLSWSTFGMSATRS